MKIKLLLISFCIVSIYLFAELPVSISIETKGGYNATDKMAYAENEAVIEKEFDVLKGLTLGFENLVVYEHPDLSDEVTLGLSLGLLDFLSIGVAPKLFIADSVTFGLDGILTIGYEFEKISFNIEDENEFLYNFNDKAFEYVNTLGIEKMFEINEKMGIGIGLENELVITKEEISDGLLIGPKLNYDFFSVYINYALGITPEVSHSAELGVAFEF